jgi:hypothetical protein
MSRFEHGSAFHIPWPMVDGQEQNRQWSLFGTGRQALRSLSRQQGWSRIWLPTYYCHDVTDALRADCDVAFYEAAPFDDEVVLTIADGEAAITVEYFGLRSDVTVRGGQWVLDLTHDPTAQFSYRRLPDFALASLRKALPIPDGGAVWSPAGLPCPDEPDLTPEHARAVLDLLTGMAIKTAYLDGSPVSKPTFRLLLERGEERLAVSPHSGISDWSRAVLRHADLDAVVRTRRDNVLAFLEACPEIAGVELVETAAYVVLLAESPEQRDHVRKELIAQNVYPAVLWALPEDGVPARHINLSRRILIIHADFRYNHADMRRVAQLTAKAAQKS